MTARDDCARLIAERLVEIFTAAHGRPPADVDELEAFIATQVRGGARAGLARPHAHALLQ
jgi:hypothetical protein